MGVAVRDSPDYEGVGLPSHNITNYGLMSDVEDCSIFLLAVSWALRLYNRLPSKLAPELPILLFSYRAFVGAASLLPLTALRFHSVRPPIINFLHHSLCLYRVNTDGFCGVTVF